MGELVFALDKDIRRLRADNRKLLAALRFRRSVINNLPPLELSEQMAIRKADKAIKDAEKPR